MRLSSLIDEVRRLSGPVTGAELARRLGISTTEVAAMLDALRASGRLGPEIRNNEITSGCSSAGSCSMTCPGPDECALTVDLNVTGLQIQSVARC
jgi:hypothetical protein